LLPLSIDGVDDVNVEAPFIAGDNVTAVAPSVLQYAGFPVDTDTVGNPYTVAVVVAVFLHPLTSV
jgi:hypothetical protein